MTMAKGAPLPLPLPLPLSLSLPRPAATANNNNCKPSYANAVTALSYAVTFAAAATGHRRTPPEPTVDEAAV